MGECGCSADMVARFPAGEGKWHVLEVHPGCTYCGAEWGLGVTLADEAEDPEEFRWWYGDVPVAEFGPHGMWGTLLLDTDILKRLFMESAGETDDLAEIPFAMDEFVSGGGMRDAYYATRKKADEDLARYKARVAAENARRAPGARQEGE